MIKKILEIKNVGKFKSPQFGKENWSGQFDQTNVIYANNGSGKTTLSLLFRSLLGENELLLKKKSFGVKESPEVRMLDEANKEIRYHKGKWNRHLENFQIFDSYFIEDNVYIITLKQNTRTQSIFEILLGEECVEIQNKINALKEQLKKLKRKRTNLRSKKNHAESEEIKKEFVVLMDKNLQEKAVIFNQIENLETELIDLSSKHRDVYLEKINQYLRVFNPNLKIGKLSQFKHRVVYTLQISGHALRTSEKTNYSLKYSLSEGDKNALSLSFFLAKIYLLPNLHEYTIIIDDPITSFDYFRKNTTTNNLINLSKKVKMFVLMTHDLTFANDFSRRLNYKCNNLKIDFNGNSSQFINHDIEKESLTGVFKDLTVLHEYLLKGAANDTERRDIARCIRPVLEGIFRIKFFREIERTEWLGDILGKIRDSIEGSIFEPFKTLLPELSEINDYSKEYHHSNPYYFETPINDEELRNYVIRTLDALKRM
jgi:wobble nucleotide-excising tRNase